MFGKGQLLGHSESSNTFSNTLFSIIIYVIENVLKDVLENPTTVEDKDKRRTIFTFQF